MAKTPMMTNQVEEMLHILHRSEPIRAEDPFVVLDIEEGRPDYAATFQDQTRVPEYSREVRGIHNQRLPRYARAAVIGEEAGLREDLLEITKLAAIRQLLGFKNPIGAAVYAQQEGLLTPSGREWIYLPEEQRPKPLGIIGRALGRPDKLKHYERQFAQGVADFQGYFESIERMAKEWPTY